ncbi:3-deoxy-D-manno-octulosonic acid transferase [Sulfurirhabdus autotrophica]|uniref:3-deoxy-D-manno-octulosonic-acid transferase n=1 Tax=Sulfurirhabdus autotrophica TaxID=1706046 RepID=A0A4R3YAU8_9PROT|nr:3-deoxy-D-manno-octulosonic acid transferase [Sulfurirhabdus autotrophica]TCV89076.1 3-deoxy-D-manno-octulosonic-acid transferase [Sulfurirhabdus autotrophica]
MGLLSLFGLGKLPQGLAGATLVIGSAPALFAAGDFLDGLQKKFGDVALGVIGSEANAGSWPQIPVPEDLTKTIALLKKIQPQRIICLGVEGRYANLVSEVSCPVYWVNASDWQAAQTDCKLIMVADPLLYQTIPHSVLTGDPLVNLSALPAIEMDTALCERFKEQREGDRWVGFFAATGEDEEEEVYPIFNRLIRHKMGLLVLAPLDEARCEPVYRESIKYKLQTIRHNRLSTSFIPIKTRVYYVEEPEPLAGMYPCVDFVVAGGSIHQHAHNIPDIITPILHGKPVILGPAHRDNPLVKAAVAAKVVLAAENSNEIFEHAKYLLENPAEGERIAAHARSWLEAQVGSLDRVMAGIV